MLENISNGLLGAIIFFFVCVCQKRLGILRSPFLSFFLGLSFTSVAQSEYCGPGTHWNELQQLCIVTNGSDSNFDGCIYLEDLLALLSGFGTCESSCGNPVFFDGYYYETTQIGSQCWFAENLLTSVYANGDSIPFGLSASEWETTEEGAWTIYGATEADDCYSSSPLGNACDSEWAFEEFGGLYNWYTTTDSRGVCPPEWHVPSKDEFSVLADFVSAEGFGGTTEGFGGGQGTALKATIGWYQPQLCCAGVDYYGYTVKPAGYRTIDGWYTKAGKYAYFWSSTENGDSGWQRQLSFSTSDFAEQDFDNHHGVPIRCLRN